MSIDTVGPATAGPRIRFPSIEDSLGPAAPRFFGGGFRRVGVALTALSVEPAPAGGRVEATAEVRYPAGWSVRDAREAPRPHLSTIDALSIAVQAAEAYLAHAFALGAEERERMWLRRYTMRAGSKPQEDLGAVPVRGVVAYTVPALGGLGHAVSTLDISVGAMRIALEIEHDVGGGPLRGPAAWRDVDEVLGESEARYYGRGFLRRGQWITEVEVDPSASVVTGLVSVGAREPGESGEPGDSGERGGRGFAGAYEPSLSMIDGIVALAQLAQAGMYGLDGVRRSGTGTLWMRRLSMSAPTPYQPLT